MKYIIVFGPDPSKQQCRKKFIRKPRFFSLSVELLMVIERVNRFRTETVAHDGFALLDQGIRQPMHLTRHAIRRVGRELL
jgi:hypothetical protein